MSHHKRRRPKHQRAGCLMCKPFKDERAAKADASPVAVQRQVQPERERPHAPGAAGFWRKVGFVLGDSLGDAA